MPPNTRRQKAVLVAGLGEKRRLPKVAVETLESIHVKSLNHMLQIRDSMIGRKVPPEWVIDSFRNQTTFNTFMSEAKVFVSDRDIQTDVQQLLYKRIPSANLEQSDVDANRAKLFDEKFFFYSFGNMGSVNEYDAFCRRKEQIPVSNISVYTPVLLRAKNGQEHKIHVINISAYESALTDLRFFDSIESDHERKVFISNLYHAVYFRIFFCAHMLQISRVICPILHIFRSNNFALTAFLDVVLFAKKIWSISTNMLTFPNDVEIYASIKTCLGEIQTVEPDDIFERESAVPFLLVNDWNPFTIPGNGRTGLMNQEGIDFYLGQHSSISVTTSSLTNPFVANVIIAVKDWTPSAEDEISQCVLPGPPRKTSSPPVRHLVKKDISAATTMREAIKEYNFVAIKNFDVETALQSLNDASLQSLMSGVQIWFKQTNFISKTMVYDLATIVPIKKVSSVMSNSYGHLPTSMDKLIRKELQTTISDKLPTSIPVLGMCTKTIDRTKQERLTIIIQNYHVKSFVTSIADYASQVAQLALSCAQHNKCDAIYFHAEFFLDSLDLREPTSKDLFELLHKAFSLPTSVNVYLQYPSSEKQGNDGNVFVNRPVNGTKILYVDESSWSPGLPITSLTSSAWATTLRCINPQPFTVCEVVGGLGVTEQVFDMDASNLAIKCVKQVWANPYAWGLYKVLYPENNKNLLLNVTFYQKSHQTSADSRKFLLSLVSENSSSCKPNQYAKEQQQSYPPTIQVIACFRPQYEYLCHVAQAFSVNILKNYVDYSVNLEKNAQTFVFGYFTAIWDLILTAMATKGIKNVALEFLGLRNFAEPKEQYVYIVSILTYLSTKFINLEHISFVFPSDETNRLVVIQEATKLLLTDRISTIQKYPSLTFDTLVVLEVDFCSEANQFAAIGESTCPLTYSTKTNSFEQLHDLK